MDYAKWDALDSSDEEASKSKQQAVRKQAVRTSAAEEQEAEAEQARLAAAEAERLQENLEILGQISDSIAQGAAAEPSAVEAAGSEPAAASPGGPEDTASVTLAADAGSSAVEVAGLEVEAATPGGPEDTAGATLAPEQQDTIPSPTSANARRRRLDHVWEVAEERAFEATQATKAEEAASRQAEAAKVAKEAEEAREVEEAKEAEAAKAREAASAAKNAALDEEVPTRSSLRRLKQLEPGTAGAIEQECGVSLKSCDGFRLTLHNAGSRLKRQTRVLIITAGSSFLCKAAAAAKDEAAVDRGAASAADGAVALECTAAETAKTAAEGSTDAGGNVAEAAVIAEAATAAECATAAEDTVAQVTSNAERAPEAECAIVAEGSTAEDTEGALSGTVAAEGSQAEVAMSMAEGDTSAAEGAAAAIAKGHTAASDNAHVDADTSAGDAISAGACGSDSVEVELRFSRARLGRGALARKLGKIPVLHITVTSDGLKEGLEFVGVHQRQYFVEDPATDAIAQNLNQSLLKVSLEFLFHPSRTRYVRETVILRECSDCAEALEVREAMMPIMAEQVRASNDKIQNVQLEFKPPEVACPAGPPAAADREKRSQRSFLILDEDMLKVAPQKDSVTSRPKNSSFRGLGRGFLNTSKAKKKDALPAGEANTAEATSESALACAQPAEPSTASSADCAAGAANSTATEDTAAAAAAVSSNLDAADTQEALEGAHCSEPPHASGGVQPPPVNTGHDDRRRLLLGSADMDVKVSSDVTEFARLADRTGPISRVGDTVAPIPEEEEPMDDEQGPASISELANQLFGDGSEPAGDGRPGLVELTDIGDISEDVQTESTKTPSPKASSRGGGALSERSERSEISSVDAGDSSAVPAAGLRLLQQRRKGRGSPKAAEEEQSKAASSEMKDESDDLVNLWMKQRW